MKEPKQPHPKINGTDPTRPKLCGDESGPRLPRSKTNSKGPKQPRPEANIRSSACAKLRRDSEGSRDVPSETKTAKLKRAMPRGKENGSGHPML